jgi:phospholipid/cholesterol/gamma-HCH transport system substrate-binding protein
VAGGKVTKKNEIITGLFVLLGVAVVGIGGVWLSGGGWRDRGRIVTARFRDVGQLKVGNRVTSRGVGVGVVETIRFAEDGTVLVEMRVREGVPVPERPVALLEPSSLFGDWEATLLPAGDRPAVAADTAGLPEGVIPGGSIPEFSELTDHTAEIASNLRDITDRLDRALSDDVAEQLKDVIANVSAASTEVLEILKVQRVAFDTLASDVRTTGRSVREASSALEGVVARLDSATAGDRLGTILAAAESSATNLRALTAEWRDAGGRANQVLTRADSALAEASVVLARISRGEGSLGRLSSDTVLYENTAAALAELRALLDEIKTNPERYFSFSIF